MEEKAGTTTQIALATVTIIILVGLAALFLLNYSRNLYSLEEEALRSHLSELTGQQAGAVKSAIENELERAVSLAAALSAHRDIFSGDAVLMLKRVCESSDYISVGLASPDGSFTSSSGETGSRAGSGYFLRAMSGEANVSDDGGIVFAAPVAQDGTVSGVLVCEYGRDYLSAVPDNSGFGGEGDIFIFDDTGGYVTPPQTSAYAETAGASYFEVLSRSDFEDESALREVKENIARHSSGGFLHYTTPAGREVYACYRPLGINGWYIQSDVPVSILEASAGAVTGLTARLTVQVAVLFVIACLVLLLVQRGLSSRVRELMSHLRLAAAQISDAVFFYYPVTNTVEFENDCYETLGLPQQIKNPLELLRKSERFDDAGVSGIRAALEDLADGEENVGFECRYTFNGQVLILLIQATAVKTLFGRTTSAAGTITDVTEQRRREQLLEHRAEHDELTHLNNRRSGMARIEGILSEGRLEDGIHAFIMMDLDNFKAVNDNYGHAAGDAVLVSFAELLRGTFRETDVVGRMGGDEFFVFMRGLPGERTVLAKLEEVFERTAEFSRSFMTDFPVSCSVGIAVTDGEDADAGTLYEQADAALYAAKRNGKNCAEIFHFQEEQDRCLMQL